MTRTQGRRPARPATRKQASPAPVVPRSLRLLVAADGSASASAALGVAKQMPWPDEVRASGVVIRQVRPDYQHAILLSALDNSADLVARRTARALAARFPGAEVRVLGGAAVDGILAEARRVRADVVVMGWRGHGAVRRLLSGSVSRGVVRRAPCSVLVARRRVRQVRHVVIGFDGSTHADRAVELVAGLAPARGSRVTVVTSIDAMHMPRQALVPADTRATVAEEIARVNRTRRAAATKALSRAARELTAAGWKVDRVITDGAPLQDLLATVQRVGAELLVVGARGATGLRHLLVGSVADGVLNRSPVPVLLVR